MLSIEPLIGNTLCESLRPHWARLLPDSHPPTFQYDFDLLRSWIRHCGDGWRTFVLTAREGSDVKGFVPLMYRDERRRGILPYRRVQFLGTHKDFDLIIGRAEDVPAIAAAAVRWLHDGRFRWELAILKDLQEGNPAIEAFQTALSKTRLSWTQSCGRYYFINLERPMEDVWADTSKKFVRRNIREARNRLDRSGPWDVLVDPQWDVDTIFRQATTMHVLRQRELDRNSMFGDAGDSQYVRQALEIASRRGILHTYWLRVNARPIAYMIGFQENSVYYFWNTGFHPDFGELSPSRYLLSEAVQDCHERGLKEFHFMRGESEYKVRWTSTFRKNVSFRIKRRKGAYGRFLGYLERIAEARSEAFQNRLAGTDRGEDKPVDGHSCAPHAHETVKES